MSRLNNKRRIIKRIEVPNKLIAQLQDGDEQAFRAIYDQLHQQVYRMLFSLVKNKEQTEDLLQNTFVSLWQNREKLNPTQSLYPYVYLTARRLAIDHFRKSVTEINAKEYLIRQSTEETNYTEEMLEVSELQDFTNELVKALPKQQQIVFMLSRNEGLSYDEIAERLQISRNTVKNHLVAALKTLKLHFQKNNILQFYFLYFITI